MSDYAIDDKRRIENTNYELDKMPNGEFVGEVYLLTHEIIQAHNSGEGSNDAFMEVEALIRDYVWMCCKRAKEGERK